VFSAVLSAVSWIHTLRSGLSTGTPWPFVTAAVMSSVPLPSFVA